jgi:hypothetical protein
MTISATSKLCTTNKYKISGKISGLTGSGLVLKNGDQTLMASGSSFEFAKTVDSGADYAVTVETQPANQICSVEGANGKVADKDVTTVEVKCRASGVTLQVEPGFSSAVASWSDAGADSYTLKLTTSATCDLEMAGCPGFAEIANAKSPATVPSLTNGTAYYFQVTANYPGGVKSVSNKTATRPNKPRMNGNVYAVATAATGVTYTGGTFTRLSVDTGGVVPVHKSTGVPSEIPNFPIIDADVTAVAADGSGGYYIGGAFTSIAGVARAGLAHIKSDGSLDAAWDPGVTGSVQAIAVHKTTVYVAGAFTGFASVPK